MIIEIGSILRSHVTCTYVFDFHDVDIFENCSLVILQNVLKFIVLDPGYESLAGKTQKYDNIQKHKASAICQACL